MKESSESFKKLQESLDESIQKGDIDALEEILIENLREYGNQLMKEMIREIGGRAEKGMRRCR